MKRIFTFLAMITMTHANAQLTHGLVAHWNFSGSSNDVSGNMHNGTPSNITYTAGKQGVANTAAVFNGTNSFITVPHSSAFNFSQYSIATVIKVNGFYTNTCQVNNIVQRGELYKNGSWGLSFFDNPYDNSCTVTGDTNFFVFHSYIGPNNSNMPNASWKVDSTIRTGRWYNVIATFDSVSTRIYVDCELVLTNTPTTTTTAPLGTTTDIVAIGTNLFGSNYSSFPYWFNGIMDDLRVYNRVLNEDEIPLYCTTFDTAVSVKPLDGISDLSVYPNPNNGGFHITADNVKQSSVTISVMNITGQSIIHKNINITNGRINEYVDITSVPNGVYMLHLKSGDQQRNIRFTIHK